MQKRNVFYFSWFLYADIISFNFFCLPYGIQMILIFIIE
nr:hypothetical protein [Morganella morganii]